MRILAIELSTGRGTIAWRDGDDEAFEVGFANDRKHSGPFFDHLRQTLERYGLPEMIAVGLGPGSYAGTRIAIATATGLQASTGAQLVGISSLRAFDTEADEYCAVGDARRDSFFFARIACRACVEGPLLCTRVELLERLSRGAEPTFASASMAEAPIAVLAIPSALVLAQIASETPDLATASPLEPIYLREPHITQPKRVLMPNPNA